MFEESPDSACDVAFEAAGDLSICLAFSDSAVSVSLALGITTEASHGHDVEGMVESPVAAVVESVPVLGLTGCRGIGAAPASRA